MEARDTDFLQLLDGRKQFSVPIFQRRYSWEKKHCERLWNDILRLGQNSENPSHFLGSIVYIEPKVSNASGIRELHVIDGQQRLTTLTLLLAALSRVINGQESDIGITADELSDYYLNNRKTDELKYKLLLTEHDKDTLIQLLNGSSGGWFKQEDGINGQIQLVEDKDLPPNYSLQLLENYRFFETRLKGNDLETVYRGIQKLRIVDIALDRNHDNPQLIFESLNSTGLTLSQADLIRNYVLMGQESKFQNILYKEYWLPMEQSFGIEYTKRFDRFIRDYLTIETKQIPNVRGVYEKFKVYLPAIEDHEILEMALMDISCYAKHYVNIALLKEQDKQLQECFKDIQDLRMEVAIPFLLEVYEDYKQGKINKSEIIQILRLIESYVFRRAICGIPTNSLNKTFAALTTEGGFDKNRYLESLKSVFSRMESYRRFPRDHEFKREFLIKDVYHFDRCNYLLRKLENYGHKEPFNAEEYTVEHIMPQNPNLSNEWKQELGENWQELQKNYLHIIGNLTLTGYNPELSDHSFSQKKELKPGGFRDSRLRLNESLVDTGRWNEIAIQKRAEELAQKALKIWISPTLNES